MARTFDLATILRRRPPSVDFESARTDPPTSDVEPPAPGVSEPPKSDITPPTSVGFGLFRVDAFKAAFSTVGLAKANRYNVYMPNLSPPLTDPSTEDGPRTITLSINYLDLFCDSVTLPGRQITTNEYYTGMRATQIAYAFGVSPITMSFYLTNNWEAWNYLNDWHKTIVFSLKDNRNYKLNFKKNYARDIIIDHFNTEDETNKVVRVINAFPTTLNEIEFGNANTDLMRVTATFAYDNWTDITNLI